MLAFIVEAEACGPGAVTGEIAGAQDANTGLPCAIEVDLSTCLRVEQPSLAVAHIDQPAAAGIGAEEPRDLPARPRPEQQVRHEGFAKRLTVMTESDLDLTV